MQNSEIAFHCIRLFFGGLCSFCAILLCAKQRSAAVVCLASFVLISYARSVYQILLALGILLEGRFVVFGFPALALFFEIVPPLFLFFAILCMILKKR